jgi:hypothetical protein
MALKPLTQAEQDAILKAFGGGKTGFKQGASQRKAFDEKRRDKASNNPASVILNVDDVKGQYDSSRALMTTIGDKQREITGADLEAFRRNIDTVRKAFKQGITANQVLDLSLKMDLDNAKEQIHTAIPVRYKGDVLHFMTNASKESEVRQHYVTVRFLDLGAIATTPIPLLTATKTVAQGYLAFDCDCGRHTFWYRYISTLGGFNAGRAETGFPKIRNPHLSGVACKHVLRVMFSLNQALAISKIKEMVKIARQSAKPLEDLPENQISAKEVKDAAKRQVEKAHHDRNQVRRSVDDPVKQRKAKKEAERFAKAAQTDAQKQRAERKRIIANGSPMEKLNLRRDLENRVKTLQREYGQTSNENLLDAMENLQNDINGLI